MQQDVIICVTYNGLRIFYPSVFVGSIRCVYGPGNAHSGVTPGQLTALRTFMEADPAGVTQREITVLMSSDPNTVASLLERMEASGWIERKAHETDRRAYRIMIRPSGKEQFETCRNIALELQFEVLKVLGPNNQELFLEQLDLVAQACRHAADNSPRAHR